MLSWRTLTIGERLQAIGIFLVGGIGLSIQILGATSSAERLFYIGGLLASFAVVLDPQFMKVSKGAPVTLRAMPEVCLNLLKGGGLLATAGIVGGALWK
jgi:hypothetical protein